MEQNTSQLINEWVEQRNIEAIIELCQTSELEFFIAPDSNFPLKSIYDILLLSYLIDDDLDSATHICKRALPDHVSEDFTILKAVLSKLDLLKHSEVLLICFQHNANPSSSSLDDSQLMDTDEDYLNKWSSEVKPFIRWFVDVFIERRVAALGSTFKIIPIETAAQLIGLGYSKASQVYSSFGWSASECGGNWVTCKNIVKDNKILSNHETALSHFDQVAKMSIRAEF